MCILLGKSILVKQKYSISSAIYLTLSTVVILTTVHAVSRSCRTFKVVGTDCQSLLYVHNT